MMSSGSFRLRLLWGTPLGIGTSRGGAVRGLVVGAVENFRFFDVKVQAFADPEAAVAEIKGEGRIKATGRVYRQEYVVFLRATGGKIAFLREYFDPTRAAKAMNAPILGLDS
jgi:ketosteroid isomerase-like protein